MNVDSEAQIGRTNPSDDELDRQLVARFLAGDQSAFDKIVLSHQRHVARLAYRLLGWPVDVEDVVQEVFVAVLSSLHCFRGESRFSTWLTTIAVNQCRSHQPRRLLWRRNRSRLIERCQETGGDRQHDDSPEIHDVVRAAVRMLPVKYREPIVLRYFQQLSISEIASVLGLSAGAVEVRLRRARTRLKEKLGRHF